MELKIINSLIKPVAKKAYVAPKVEVKTLESLGIKREQLLKDTINITSKQKFSFGTKVQPEEKILQLGSLFRDKTTRFCEISLKKSANVSSYFTQYINSLPSRYVRVLSNSRKEIKDCMEIDTFEMLQKGNGLGSKKLQEIIKYAKDNHEGRLYLNAAKCGNCNSPVLFYYKNGLRSVDNEINLLLEKISKGELPLSKVPDSTVMYLP